MVWNYVIAVAITAVISYLLGCCNTSIVISKYFLRDDVRNHGSGNAGLTNFYRVFGQKKILFVILADVMKTVAVSYTHLKKQLILLLALALLLLPGCGAAATQEDTTLAVACTTYPCLLYTSR